MKIFISYRRDDSAGHAGRLYDHLKDHFGTQNIFMDIDTIQPGEDFRKAIENAVGACDVALVLIGKQWLNAKDLHGLRRLDDPHDFVRAEVASAIANPKIRVIPVLVRGASMPGAHELPEILKELAWRNAIELSDNRFQYDAKRLIGVIEQLEPQPATTLSEKVRRIGAVKIGGLILAFLLLISIILGIWYSRSATPKVNTPTSYTQTAYQDWETKIELDLSATPCEPRLLPSSIDPAKDITDASQKIKAAIDSGEFIDWPVLYWNSTDIVFAVTSLVTDQEKLRVSDTFLVDVALQDYLPGTVNILDASACGGIPPEILLPPLALVGLSNQVNRYNQEADYSNADLFVLEPGDPRYFGLPIKCSSSGIYRLNINISFEYGDLLNVTNSNEPLSIACPGKFILWHYDAFIDQFYLSPETYQWNGNEYEVQP